MGVRLLSLLFCAIAGAANAGDLPPAAQPTDFPVPGATSVLLGRDLFFDPILSGNRNISCATCHSPDHASADGVSLTLGQGAKGLGRDRTGPAARISRHTPALFNLGAFEFRTLTLDGRVRADPSTRFGFDLPKGMFLERPVPSTLAAQALLPLVAADEMAGAPGDNPIADAVAAGNITGLDGAWDRITRRVDDTPAYRQRFDWLIGADEPLHITHIAQVLADFVTYEFRSTNSPFDAFLAGDDSALTNDQLRGMALFYGKAQCGTCHSGTFQTDHRFYALGLPQFGPGKGHGADGSDHGRAAITGDTQDRHRFRTPSLRNVAMTAPYGHSGAFDTLDAMIRHHLDPMTSLAEYTGETVILPGADGFEAGAMDNFDEVLAIAAAIDIAPAQLSDRDVAALITFLDALSDPTALDGRLGVPETVPSGLPFDHAPLPPS